MILPMSALLLLCAAPPGLAVPVLPSVLVLPVHVYLAPSWMDKFGGVGGGGRQKAKKVMDRVAEFFMHTSLDTKFKLKYNDSSFYISDEEIKPTPDDDQKLSRLIKSPEESTAIVYLGYSSWTRNSFYAYKFICDNNKKSARSIVLWQLDEHKTAQSVAQQMGRNLGFYLDFEEPKSSGSRRKRKCGPGKDRGGPDNDLMNLGSPRQSKWSDCTNEDFRNYYLHVVNNNKNFCLQEGKSNSEFRIVQTSAIVAFFTDNNSRNSYFLGGVAVGLLLAIAITLITVCVRRCRKTPGNRPSEDVRWKTPTAT